MSSIVIKGNTSGQIELAAPDVAGSTTLTLPTGSGTVITDTAPKAGSVIQVVSTPQNSGGSAFSTTSTSFVDTGYNLSITPSSTSSKILILTYGAMTNTTTGSGQAILTVYRDSTNISNLGTTNGLTIYENASSGGFQWVPSSIAILDSPNTTNSVNYRLYLRVGVAGQAYYSLGATGNGITLMEIAG